MLGCSLNLSEHVRVVTTLGQQLQRQAGCLAIDKAVEPAFVHHDRDRRQGLPVGQVGEACFKFGIGYRIVIVVVATTASAEQ